MKRSPLKRKSGLKARSGLKAKSQSLKRSSFKKTVKVNKKNFTEEQIIKIWSNQKHRCAHCSAISCWQGEGGMQYGDVHHMKKKSSLVPHEIETHGPGGGILNGVGLCRDCHTRTEMNDPEMAKYRTYGWQEIGQTEQEWKDDLPDD